MLQNPVSLHLVRVVRGVDGCNATVQANNHVRPSSGVKPPMEVDRIDHPRSTLGRCINGVLCTPCICQELILKKLLDKVP